MPRRSRKKRGKTTNKLFWKSEVVVYGPDKFRSTRNPAADAELLSEPETVADIREKIEEIRRRLTDMSRRLDVIEAEDPRAPPSRSLPDPEDRRRDANAAEGLRDAMSITAECLAAVSTHLANIYGQQNQG